MLNKVEHSSVATRNSCRVCAPLGSSMVFLGIEGCMPLVHGSQGCSTYIRRYMIGHFREPVDIASSNFSEHSAVFGGGKNLLTALDNIMSQYQPTLIGVSTSCLSETMGEDIQTFLQDWPQDANHAPVVNVSTPSYKGSHRDGFYECTAAVLQQLALLPGEKPASPPLEVGQVNLLPGFCSCEDIRHFKEILEDFGLKGMVFPDYSQTLDDGQWGEWQSMPRGGTSLVELQNAGLAQATIEFELPGLRGNTTGQRFEQSHGVKNYRLPFPLGIEACDALFEKLSDLSGCALPDKYRGERARLLDAYVDAHKFAYGVRVALFGDEELVCGLAQLVVEIGMIPVICATGGNVERLRAGLVDLTCEEDIHYVGLSDFEDLSELCSKHNVSMMIGNSKGYAVSRDLRIPLVRVGFPVHDRMGGQRILHVGYRGTQQLFDRIVNQCIATSQDSSPVGYMTY